MARSRSFRVVRFVLLALLGVAVGYGVIANAFLSFGGVQWALGGTDDIRINFRRAWTLWPGTVHIRNARILFQDHNLEWSLDAETLEADLAFRGFLSKTIHATRVRGEGTVFRVRQRVVAADALSARTRALPPIPEFPTPALVPAYVPAAPRTDLWRLHLEDVDVGVVELWAQQLRYLGSGRARGAFRLHAGHHLWVGPATLDLDPGKLVASERVLVGRLFGHIECVVHPLFVNVPVGRELFRNFSVKVDLHGQDVRLEPLDLFLPGTELHSPGARLDLALTADHGVLDRASRIELRGPELRVRHRDWVFDGGAFGLDARSATDGLGEVEVRLEDAHASRSQDPLASRMKLATGSVTAATTSLDTSANWGLARVAVALSRLEIPVLSNLDDLVRPHGVRLEAGSARIDADARYSGAGVSGEGRALLTRARGKAMSVGWELDGTLEASLSRVGGEVPADSLDLAISSRRLAVVDGATRVEGKDAHVTARARLNEGRGGAQVRTTAQALSIQHGRARVTGKAHAELELSAIDLSRRALQASATGEIASLGATTGTGPRGRARHVGLETEFSLVGTKLSRGWLDVKLRSLSARAGATAISGDAHVFAEAKELDVAKGRGSATSVVLVKHLVARDTVGGAKCQYLSVARAALRGKLAFSPDQKARVDIVVEVEKARARWDDFVVAGDARLVSRYLESSSAVSQIDLLATKIQLKSGRTETDGWEAKVPSLRVLSTLRRDLGSFSGPVSVRVDRATGRIGRAPVHADLFADLRLSRVDLDRGEAIGSGSVRIEHAGLAAGPVPIDNWWGTVKVPLLSVTAEENLEVFGDYRADLRDGLPILALFARSGDLPAWVPRMFPLEKLEARGHFSRRCRTTDLVIEQASGGPVVMAGRIQSTPTDLRAAVLVQLKSPALVSAGLAIYDASVGVSAFAGNSWLSRQSETLDGWEVAASCEAPPASCPSE